MSQHFAVIDLGTNTFHILIAQAGKGDEAFEVLYKERRFVKLAEEGIETIGQGALKRAWEAMAHFSQVMQQYNVVQIKAVGTAALRTASNGRAFVEEVKEKLGVEILIINGFQEAELIAGGVSYAIPNLQDEPYLIIDIGGGSVEFIIVRENKVIWKGSFLVGVALLCKNFHKSDPIQHDELVTMKAFLQDQLADLRTALDTHPCRILVGASGTFDVLENFIQERETGKTYSRFGIGSFHEVYEKLLPTTLVDRMRNAKIPLERVEMLISALILIHTVVGLTQIEEIIVSAYALKEGLLAEIMHA